MALPGVRNTLRDRFGMGFAQVLSQDELAERALLLDRAHSQTLTQEEADARAAEFMEKVDKKRAKNKRVIPAPTVRVQTMETHDGDECDCITATHELKVGEAVELTHVCHTGRVDKLLVKIVEIVDE